MRVASLWRYPVKSMQGERRERVQLTETGIAGDRKFGVLDLTTGTIISAKKDGRLLAGRAMLAGVELTIRLPTGETVLGLGSGADAALSGWLGRPVELVEARPEGRGTYEMPVDFEDDASRPLTWEGPKGSFVDSAPIHLITSATLHAVCGERPELQWKLPRFRPNIVVDAGDADELSWIGRQVSAGPVLLDIVKACSRCVMTTRPQPGDVSHQLDILRHLNSARGGNLGVLARVVRSGTLEAGEPISVDGERP